ncbi:MAG: hypothetical protein ACRDPR_16225, partial [Nocardioidaceae bacterium]
GEACDDCSIRSAFLRQYQGAPGAESAIPGADIPVTVVNDGGDLTGSYDGPYSPLATSVQLFVAAADLSLLEATGVSPFTPVDNVDPNLVIGRTGDVAGQDRSTIRVFLSERVAVNAAMSPSDWKVADHQVAAAQLNEAAHNGRVGDIAFLTVAPQLGRNEEPQVTYAPAGNPQRAFDRVGQTVADKAVNTIDGILPALPTVQRVAGMGLQAGKFYTNDSTPTFELSSATGGDRACIYRDINGNGAVDPGTDTLISKETAEATIAGCPVAEGSSLAVETRGLPTSDAELGVLVQFTDARNNVGPNSSNALVLDYTAPAIAEVAVAGTDVTVTFSEFVARGRNFASDWVVFATRPGGTFKPFVGQVTGSGTTRTLAISDERYDAAVNNVTAVAYEYQGALTDRYEDRATNKLDNATFVR